MHRSPSPLCQCREKKLRPGLPECEIKQVINFLVWPTVGTMTFFITVKQKVEENNFHFYALCPLPSTRLMRMVLWLGLRKQINHMFTSSLSLSWIWSMKSGVVRSVDVELCCCLQQSKKIQSLLLFGDRELYHTIYTPNFVQNLTLIHLDLGEYTENKSFFFFNRTQPHIKQWNRYFKGKTVTWFLIVLQGPQTSCGGSGLDLKGLQKKIRLVVTPEVKFIDWIRSHVVPCLEAVLPLLSRGTILLEKSAKWRETWVCGMAESGEE